MAGKAGLQIRQTDAGTIMRKSKRHAQLKRGCGEELRKSTKQFHDRFTCGQGAQDTGRVFGIVDGDVEGVIDRRGQFFRADGIIGWILAVLVRFAVDLASGNSSAGENR